MASKTALFPGLSMSMRMGVRENFVLGHTDLKIVRRSCQSDDIVKIFVIKLGKERAKVMQIDIIQFISSKVRKKRRQNSNS